MVWGGIYVFFVKRASNRVLGYAFAGAVLLTAYQLESASIKLLGGGVMRFLVIALLFKLLEPRVAAWLCDDSKTELDSTPPLPYEVGTAADRSWGWRA